MVIYGGSESHVQKDQLSRGCDLLIATPGRLKDFIERGQISLAQVRHVVLDEADRMLDMGFERDMRAIMESSNMTRDESRQTLMFSATFPSDIQILARDFLKDDYCRLRIGRYEFDASPLHFVTLTYELIDCFSNALLLAFVVTLHDILDTF